MKGTEVFWRLWCMHLQSGVLKNRVAFGYVIKAPQIFDALRKAS